MKIPICGDKLWFQNMKTWRWLFCHLPATIPTTSRHLSRHHPPPLRHHSRHLSATPPLHHTSFPPPPATSHALGFLEELETIFLHNLFWITLLRLKTQQQNSENPIFSLPKSVLITCFASLRLSGHASRWFQRLSQVSEGFDHLGTLEEPNVTFFFSELLFSPCDLKQVVSDLTAQKLKKRGSTPPDSGRESWRGTQTRLDTMQRPGHTGRKALAKKKKF